MKKFRNIAAILVIICLVVIIASCTYYNINIGKVSDDPALKEITIKEGSIGSIAVTLKEQNLIKNITIFKLYTKLTNKTNLKAGIYELSEDMGVKKIVDVLETGSKINPNEVSITFKEGINIRKIATLIEENTNNTYDDVLTKLNDQKYINGLIEKYWFLTDNIKSNKIYYPLEGYLYPNTYRFSSKDVSVEEIFEKMLEEMDKKITPYKEEIQNSDLNVHEILTLSSIVELEGAKANDRKKVAGVFYNRINDGWSLGSDVTTYYALKIDDFKTSLTEDKGLYKCDYAYNTRCDKFIGLPVGPICNPSIESIEASIEPEKHNYYYFVADCKGQVYLSKNSTEHYNIINKLKKENNWCV
ncbi:MAG: endolytic transglycosylase MltG [Bacilli bacterium]